jgi:hypothetical protein
MSEHLTGLGRKLKALLDKKNQLAIDEKEVNTKITRLQSTFVEAMELNKLQNFQIKNVGQFYLHTSTFAKIINKEEFFTYLRQKGAEDLIKETVFPSTVRAYTKECVENLNEVPLGIEVTPKTTVRVRKI